MILAHHSIFSFYGFWLPNDPRGSGSDYIAVWELFRYGPATKVNTRHSVAHRPVDPTWKQRAATALAFPPLLVTGRQALAVIEGFREAIAEGGYAIHACAILPDHVHLVIGRHERDIRQIVGHLKAKATRKLRESGLLGGMTGVRKDSRRSASQASAAKMERPVWGEHGWNVALETTIAVERGIAYVEANPEKEGKRRQQWDFITEFNEDAARLVKYVDRRRRIGGAALESRLMKEKREARRKRRG